MQENEDFDYGCDECGDKFVSCDEHLSRAHNQSTTILCNDVIDHILDFRHPNDLVKLMSHRCGRYNEMVPKYFQRKRKCGWVRIISRDGKPNFDFNQKEKYEETFRSIIRNVEVSLTEDDQNCKKNESVATVMFNFIKDNCSKKIQSLVLEGGLSSQIQINEQDISIIGDQIEHLETFALGYGAICNIEWNRLKNLQILYDNASGKQTWMTQKFPKLRTLYLWTISANNNNKLQDFLQNNMQLDNFVSSDLRVFNSILSSKIKLSTFVFHVGKQVNDEKVLNELNKCYNQIDSLKIISELKKVKGLIFKLNNIQELINNEEIQMLYIRCLQSVLNEPTTETLLAFVKKFPNLTELSIYFTGKSFASPSQIVSILIKVLPKLKYLYFPDVIDFDGEKYDLRNWIPIRLATVNFTPHLPEMSEHSKDIKSDLKYLNDKFSRIHLK